MEDSTSKRRTHATPFHLPTAPSPNGPDPLGILKVSGIYGSGTSAGWLLTVTASWLAIFASIKGRNKKGIHHDLVMHVVFTNWAAIDLLRQLGLRQAADADEARKEFGGAIAAALTITFWGLQIALWQFGFCVFIDNKATRSPSQAVWDLVCRYKRSLVLLSGTLLPSIALVVFGTYLSKVTDDGYGIADSLPALYLDGFDRDAHWGALVGVSCTGLLSLSFLFMCIGFAAPCLLYVDTRHRAPIRARRQIIKLNDEMSIAAMLPLPLAASFCVSALIFFFLSGSYIRLTYLVSIVFLILLSVPLIVYAFLVACMQCQSKADVWRGLIGLPLAPSILYMFLSYVIYLGNPTFHVWWWLIWLVTSIFLKDTWRKTCFLMPCAPQKISDWDQAFGLMVGLVMLAVEIGPGFVKWASGRRNEDDGLTAALLPIDAGREDSVEI